MREMALAFIRRMSNDDPALVQSTRELLARLARWASGKVTDEADLTVRP
jgi:hypothetical protein